METIVFTLFSLTLHRRKEWQEPCNGQTVISFTPFKKEVRITKKMRKDLFRRYLLFSVSVFINALGISVITKAMLGTSAISSVPFVLSCFTPFTMGTIHHCHQLAVHSAGVAAYAAPGHPRQQVPTGFPSASGHLFRMVHRPLHGHTS